MPDQIFRVGGGYTAFVYNGQPLLYVDIVSETGPRPVAAAEPIQPLDSAHPIEIAFPRAATAGTLQLRLREEWNRQVWERIPGFAGAVDIAEVFQRNINNGSVTCTKIVTGPNGQRRGLIYHGCVVTDIDDSESIQINTMTIGKNVTLMYTHKTLLK